MMAGPRTLTERTLYELPNGVVVLAVANGDGTWLLQDQNAWAANRRSGWLVDAEGHISFNGADMGWTISQLR